MYLDKSTLLCMLLSMLSLQIQTAMPPIAVAAQSTDALEKK